MAYQLPAPSTLEDIFSMNPGAFNQAQQFMQGGVAQNEADLQKSQIANLFDQQNNPQLLQQQALQNQTMGAQLPGIQANSDMMGMNRDKQKELFPEALKAARNKFLAEATEHDITQLEQHAQKLAYTAKTPEEREQAERFLMMHKDMVRDRNKQDAQMKRQLALSAQAHRQTMERDDNAIAKGKYNQGKNSGDGSIKDQITSGKLTYEKAASMLSGAAFMLDMEGDLEKAAQYREMATQYAQKAESLRGAGQAQGQAGKVDIGKLGGIPVNPQPTINPFAPVQPRGAAPNIAQDIEQGAQFSSPAVEAQVRAKAGVPTDNTALMKAVRAAGQTYEPNKYDYRVTPDGRVQRKLKE